MPWFRHPLAYRGVHPDPNGPVRLSPRAEVPIELERAPGDWIPVRAVLDTGASLSVFSATWARAMGFQLPAASFALTTNTAAGTLSARVFDLDVPARFRALPEVPFALSVVFSEAHPPNAPPLLGLHNLLNFWRYTFDGAPEPAAPLGHMRFQSA